MVQRKFTKTSSHMATVAECVEKNILPSFPCFCREKVLKYKRSIATFVPTCIIKITCLFTKPKDAKSNGGIAVFVFFHRLDNAQ